MVLPDGAPAGSERQSLGGRALLVVGAIALAIGGLTIGALTSPDPEAVVEPSTTTTTTEPLKKPIDFDNFTVDQIALGTPLEWQKVSEVEGGWNSTLVSQLGWLYLFTSGSYGPGLDRGGARVYRTVDGTNWDDLGTVGSTEGYVAGAAATPFGLMAVENDYAGGSVMAWRSTNGADWEQTVIADAGDGLTSLNTNVIGANASMVVVAGNVYEDPTTMLEQKLRDIGLDVDTRSLGGWNLIPSSEGSTVVIYGPLSIPALSIPASELGLTQEEEMLLQGLTGSEAGTRAWSTTDGVTWTPSTIGEADWISSLTPAPDGALLAFGQYSAGNTLWRTYDGSSWEKLPFGLRAQRAAPWKGRLVGLGEYGAPEAFLSEDGETWDEMGLAEYFPQRISWYPSNIATSDAVVAIDIQGFPSGSTGPGTSPAPVTIERDGVTLTLRLDQGQIQLENGESITQYSLYGSQSEDLVVDLVGKTVTFLGSSGEKLATFSFEELQRAERDYWMSTYPDNGTVNALAYTRDGRTWAVQDLDAVFDHSSQLVAMAATPFDLVAVAVVPGPSRVGPDRVQIWTAPLP